ncbi:hypothetical protein H6P81_005764 [Aristolochia fimbriata]|uniref:Protein PAM68, chloroplastic n=1 Tax=Aristolochia fimbriata TaxID=158543 RepID=A0AAV7EXK7_ARIFI|nr:hypothetical protein H6P81_005764 [Aristolochia fimbriata]
METCCPCLRTTPSSPLYIPSPSKNAPFLIPIPLTRRRNSRFALALFPPSALKSPRGFGPSPKKNSRKQKKRPTESNDEDESDDDGVDESDDSTIPEIVTNRMISRMGLTVGIPLAIGLLFFPFFYYLKVVVKVDVPTWVPFIVSFFFFGSALLGVSYGIVSSSWDPLREGSLLGWNEAQKNWPVFWQSLWGRSGKK